MNNVFDFYGVHDLIIGIRNEMVKANNMMLKNVTLLLLGLLLLCGCREETSYQMQLVIENKSDIKISVELFPKEKYMQNNLYKFCDFGGGFRETTFELEENNEIEIYITSDLDIKPYSKITEIFDSIHISAFVEKKYEIRFSPEMVVGYEENLFNEQSTWTMKVRRFDLPTSFQNNPVESNDNIFAITKEKITPQ